MKKIILISMILLSLLFAGCGHKTFEKINKNEEFIASVNILQETIDFINKDGEKIANWTLDESYTGAILVGNDAILLYGNQLDHADLIRLSTGEIIKKIALEEGTTNAYYNYKTTDFYLTNGQENNITSYDKNGEMKLQTTLGNYPMAMYVEKNKLYVINFKDDYLSVLNSKTMKELKRYQIPKSSHGLDLVDGELWIGGHGAGEKPNSKVRRMNLKTGGIIGMIDLPMMPISFANVSNSEYILSHGENMLYEVNDKGKVVWNKEIGSNPFTIVAFQKAIVLAGYDDQTLYWIKDHKIIRQTKVGKGPFNLLVREEFGS